MTKELNGNQNNEILLKKWNVKWDEFKETVKQECSPKVYDFFKDTTIIKARHFIPALFIKVNCYEIIVKKGKDIYVIKPNENHKWQTVVAKDFYGKEKNGLFHERFNATREESIKFNNMLFDFGIIDLCKEIGIFEDKYTKNKEEMSSEEFANGEFISSLFSSSVVSKMMEKSVFKDN